MIEPSQVPPRGHCADRGYTYVEIETEAIFMREVLEPDLFPHERLRGIELFENLHRFSVRVGGRKVPFDYSVKNLPRGPEAFALYDHDAHVIVLVMSVDTYRALERGHRRSRFTFAHEVGHATLHAALLQRLSHIPHRQAALQRGSWSNHPTYMDTEWQADAFAGALLMPARGLLTMEEQGKLDVDSIMAQFTVSLTAAQKRLAVYVKHKTDLLASGV